MPRIADAGRFWIALRSPERVSACSALVDGALTVLVLKRHGLAPLLRLEPPRSRNEPHRARRIAATVDAALGLLPAEPTCLRRSVTLLRELHRRRLRATLCIGVRPGPGGVEAHAWVQVGDHVINDDPEQVATYVLLSDGEAGRVHARIR